MNIALLEINEEGRAISWQGDLNDMMKEAFHIIAERVESCGSIEESMKLLIKHLDAWKDSHYTYAFTIDEVGA